MVESETLPLVVFYDGECPTCHALVRFLLGHARAGAFRFVPLAAVAADPALRARMERSLGERLGDTVVVARGQEFLGRSEGVFAIAHELGGLWQVARLFRYLPRSLRDGVYDVVAKNRFRFTGKTRPEALCERPPAGRGNLLLSRAPAWLSVKEPAARQG